MAKIIKIEQAVPVIQTKKKVAAYARVSMESERMNHSLSAQISYYSSLIQKNPSWQYAGVYADYGITGTLTAKREQFQKMLSDCEAGKIDIILTKSISRFARNTVDLLETVRHLKSIGVEVRFEKEKINSFSEDGELMLSLLASFAQEESRSISENCKWGIRKRFQSGEIGVANKRILGYQYDEDQKKYLIVPEEAESVRWMFQMYIDDVTLRDIADRMNRAGIRTIRGYTFQEASVRQLIFNEIYAGDMIRQKCYIADPIQKNKVKNHGELPQYYMADCHEAIIDRETYAKVKAEMERRASLVNPAYCFTAKIHCGICGANYARKKGIVKGRTYVHWICRSKKEVGTTCSGVNFSEEELKNICAKILELDSFDEEAFESQVKDIVVLENGDVEFSLVGGETKRWKNLHLNDTRHTVTLTDAFQGKIRCAKCGKTYHRVNSANRWVYWYCIGKRNKVSPCDSVNYTDFQLRQISAHMLGLDEFDEQAFTERVEEITVLADGSLEYRFFGGRTAKWRRT
jgi:site-specific DNA recombinase